MKRIDELIIKLNQFINPDFFSKDLEVNELIVSDFNIIKYDYVHTDYYNPRGSEGNRKFVENNLEKIKKFIEEVNINDFIKINKFNIYYSEIIDEYIFSLFKVGLSEEEIMINLLKGNDDFKYIFRSGRLSYLFLKIGEEFNESYYNKYKESAEEGLLSGDPFWGYIYCVNILDGPFPKLEKYPLFFNNKKIVNKYIYKIIFKRGFLKPKSDEVKIFKTYWNHPTLKEHFREYFLTLDLIEVFYYLKDAHIPELEQYLIEKRLDDFVQYFFDITFFKNHMEIEEKNISKNTEKLKDKISRISKMIIDDPNLLYSFISRVYNYEGIFKTQTGMTLNEYIKENFEHIKVTLLKDVDALFRVISYYYLKKHSLVKKEFPEAIEAVLNSKDPDLNFFYVKNLIVDAERRTDPKDLQRFLDVISKSPKYSLEYAKLINEPFPQGEEVIFKSSEYKKDYLKFIKRLKK